MAANGDNRLKQLNHKRRGIRNNTTKELSILDDLMADANIADTTEEQLSGQLQIVLTFANHLPELNNEIISLLDDDGELTDEVDTVSELDNRITRTVSTTEVRIRKLVKALASTPSGNGGPPSLTADRVFAKLPKLELAHFTGNPLEWQGFWDSFQTTIDENDFIADIDKFKYLKSFLEEEALQEIDGFRLTADNYSVAVSTLKERFGNPEMATFAHFEQLLALPSADKDPSKLKSIYSECEKHIRSLVALGLSEDTFGRVFTPIILSKLPRATRIQLHRTNGSNPWKLGTLRSLMKEEIQTRNMSDRIAGNYGVAPAASKPPNTNSGPSQSKTDYPKKSPSANKPFTPKASWSTQGAMVNTTSPNPKCAFCSGGHFSTECRKYKTAEERKRVIHGQCFKCLGSHHLQHCRRSRPCFYCKSPTHHSSICFKEFGEPKQAQGHGGPAQGKPKPPGSSYIRNPQATLLSTPQKAPTIMKMATVHFPQVPTTARIFLDDGSTTSYISTKLAKQLNLELTGQELVSVGRFGSRNRKTESYRTAKVPIPLSNGKSLTLQVYVTDTITCPIQKLPIDPKDYPAFQHLPLADSLCGNHEMVNIDILIGGDYLHELMTGERISLSEGLYLYGSQLGYIVAGRLESSNHFHSTDTTALVFFRDAHPMPAGKFELERFWSLEDIGIKDNPYQNDDIEAVTKFNSSIQFRNGRYEVALPWKEENPQLSSNYGLATGRLKSLQQRMSGQPELLKWYNDIIKDQLDNGIIEEVDQSLSASRIHYLPHHGVVRMDKPSTKLRIVYDASAKTKRSNLSLNECLHRGPVILQDLCGVLLRFRVSAIAIACDVEKAFLQVGIQLPDRDVTRFLWLRDPTRPITAGNLIIYRFCRVLFGLICSQFLLSGTVKYHIDQNSSDVASDISRNLYVDNITANKNNLNDCVRFYKGATALFQELSMTLRQWHSNSAGFLQNIPEAARGKETVPKILGLPWDPQADTLTCVGAPLNSVPPNTKRLILAATSTVFDPCGFFSPVVLKAKLFVQYLWETKQPWDKVLSSKDVSSFAEILANLQDIPRISLPRMLNSLINHPNAVHEIHCFCDASAKAYAAVAYVRSSIPEGKADIGLAFSKARLAPCKKNRMTIPRLELMAAVIGGRITRFVNQELDVPVTRIILWCDSKCVLFWLQSSRTLKVFVRNRIRELQSHKDFSFRYVPTLCNPADIPSKGATLEELASTSLWPKGPQFLLLNENLWPENEFDQTPNDISSEAAEYAPEKSEISLTVTGQPPDSIGNIIDPSRYHSWKKLLRVTVLVLRFIKRIRGNQNRQPPHLVSQADLSESETLWISAIQSASCADYLRPQASISRQLGLFTDEAGIVRCRGRLELSDLDDSAKSPKLLPKNHPVTDLIILDCHTNLAHAGVRQTLAQLRYDYWVVHGRSQVQKVIRKCSVCIKADGGPYKLPANPPLPNFRVSQSHPFDNTGIDYFGPLYIKHEIPEQCSKVWICLFTCCATRAVHLDVVTDLSSEQFMLCFRRFVSLYGSPSLIVSDNAKQFKTADSTLKAAFQEAQQTQTGFALDWKFITELAPWMGGFYERLVGNVKRSLRKTLGQRRLTLLQLQTIVFEIASIVNSRPLVACEHEPGELALTPAHFLISKGRKGLPNLDANDEMQIRRPTTSEALLNTWKTGQKILEEYWKTWRNEYLASLRERPLTNFHQRNTSLWQPTVGSLIQIKEDLPRCRWKMGIIEALFFGSDGQCRSATIRMPNQRLLTRPLKLLYPIEQAVLDDFSHSRQQEENQEEDPEPQEPYASSNSQPPQAATTTQRLSRRAAQDAHGAIQAGFMTFDSDDE